MDQENPTYKNFDDIQLLTLEEVAEILKLSLQTIRRYIHRAENPIPVIYLSNQEMRIRKSDLIDWMKALPDPRLDV